MRSTRGIGTTPTAGYVSSMGDTGGAEWRESSGMHVLTDADGKEIGRVWGWKASAPWHAIAGGRQLGEFDTPEEARAAVEAAARRG